MRTCLQQFIQFKGRINWRWLCREGDCEKTILHCRHLDHHKVLKFATFLTSCCISLWKEVSLIRNLAAECPLPAHQNTADSSHNSSAESAPKAPRRGGKELQHQDSDKESFLSQNTMLKSMQALLLHSALDMRPQ